MGVRMKFDFVLRLSRRHEEVHMLTTLAVIGALAILAWFVRAIGLRRIRFDFDGKPIRFRAHRSLKDEKPPKQLNQ
jgi:hypothetical protein